MQDSELKVPVENRNVKENVILSKTFDFALCILDLYQVLNEKKHFALANQLVKSGTSIGANVREAQRAVSKADFINKLSIALKEAEETDYWFELIDRKILTIGKENRNQLDEITRLLVRIINTTKSNNTK